MIGAISDFLRCFLPFYLFFYGLTISILVLSFQGPKVIDPMRGFSTFWFSLCLTA